MAVTDDIIASFNVTVEEIGRDQTAQDTAILQVQQAVLSKASSADLAAKQSTSAKNKANGYAGVGNDRRIAIDQTRYFSKIIQSASLILQHGQQLLVDTSVEPITGTLPIDPAALQLTASSALTIRLRDAKLSFAKHPLTLVGNGELINGSLTNLVIDVPGVDVTATWAGGTMGWNIDVTTLDSSLSPRRFGAIPGRLVSGVAKTINTAALTAALAASSAVGAYLDLGGRTWVVDGPLPYYAASSWGNGRIHSDAPLSPTNANDTDWAMYPAEGSIGADTPLTADAVAGAAYPQTIQIASTTGWAHGDLLKIQDRRLFDHVASHVTGELARVLAVVDGTTLQLDRPLTYSYKSGAFVSDAAGGEGKIRKITPNAPAVRDFRLTGPIPPDHPTSAPGTPQYRCGLRFRYADRCSPANVKVSGFNVSGMTFHDCWEPNVDDACDVTDIPDWYGYVVSGATHGAKIFGSAKNCRHPITLSGGEGLVLHTLVQGGTLVGREAALDGHTGVDHTTWAFCKLRGQGEDINPHGAIYQGRNLTAIGNEITGYLANGMIWQSLHRNHDPAQVTMMGNTAEATTVSAGSLSAFAIQTQPNCIAVDRVAGMGNTGKGPWANSFTLQSLGPEIANFNLDNTLIGGTTRGYYIRAQGGAIRRGVVKGAVVPGGVNAYPGVTLWADAGQTLEAVTVDTGGFSNVANAVARTGSGAFSRIKIEGRQEPFEVATDANVTVQVEAGEDIQDTAALTAERTLTFSTTNAFVGQKKRYTRTGGGDFLRMVNGRAFAQQDWGEFTYRAAGWDLTEFGTRNRYAGDLTGLSGAPEGWDFRRFIYRSQYGPQAAISADSRWAYARAATGNASARNRDGTLAQFATGAVRRTDQGLFIGAARTNLLTSPLAPATQDVAVTAQAYTLSFYGTGTVTLSGAHAQVIVGTGASQRTIVTFTPAAGTLTLTITGGVTTAQLVAAAYDSEWVAAQSDADAPTLTLTAGSQGTLVIEGAFGAETPESESLFVWSDGTNSNRVAVSRRDSDGILRVFVIVAGVTRTIEMPAFAVPGPLRLAISWGAFGVSAAFLGGPVLTSAGAVPTMTSVRFGAATATGLSWLNGYVRQFLLWPGEAKSDLSTLSELRMTP